MQDLKTLMDIIDKMMEWLEANQDANEGDYRERYREVDSLSRPVLQTLYKACGEENNYDFDNKL